MTVTRPAHCPFTCSQFDLQSMAFERHSQGLSGCQRRAGGIRGEVCSGTASVLVSGFGVRSSEPTDDDSYAGFESCTCHAVLRWINTSRWVRWGFRHWPFDDGYGVKLAGDMVGAGDVRRSRGIEGYSLGRHSGRDGSARLVNGAVTRAGPAAGVRVVASGITSSSPRQRRRRPCFDAASGVKADHRKSCAGSTGRPAGVGSTLVDVFGPADARTRRPCSASSRRRCEARARRSAASVRRPADEGPVDLTKDAAALPRPKRAEPPRRALPPHNPHTDGVGASDAAVMVVSSRAVWAGPTASW